MNKITCACAQRARKRGGAIYVVARIHNKGQGAQPSIPDVLSMSKGKKGSKTTPEAVGWDEGLISAAVQEVELQNVDCDVVVSVPRDYVRS